MIIKLTSAQIPEYWELIKYAYAKGDLIPRDCMPNAFNSILHSLLSDKSQCFLRISDDRQIIALMITRIILTTYTKDKILFIQCIFSFRKVADSEWQIDWKFVQNFAKKENCKYIEAESANTQIYSMLSQLGVKEFYRVFRLQI